ncbi:urea transporter 1-like [Palaemon carinicauda]|uniref:urea transporter 1-like n=1 Tax=Palaemon carinicauda TaxID=392227 RepID=UPI0035B5FAE0
MQPQIFVTGVPEKNNSPLHQPEGSSNPSALLSPHTNNNRTDVPIPTHLSVPTWETTARRPSCLPNDTDISLRPKLRKFSSYDLSINDSINADSFEASVSIDTYEDLMDQEPPPCLEGVTKWFVGDAQYITDFLDRWPFFSFAMPLKLVNAVLRTIGAPMLANNPFSGALVLVALSIESPVVLAWGLSALLVALLVSLLLKQPPHIVSSGQITQHGFLLGLSMGHASQHLTHLDLYPTAIVLAIAAAISVLLGNALASWLSQTNLPGLTLPYIVVGICLVHLVGTYNFQQAQISLIHNTTYPADLQWSMVLQGAVRGAGQVYGCIDLTTSSLVLTALLIFSPMAFLHACTGSLTGTLFGLLVSDVPYHSVYLGQYGWHSFLTSLSLGGFFFVFNSYSSITAIAGAAFSALLYHSLSQALIPVLTTPHVLATLILLHARIRGGLLKRVDLVYITFPEMHRRLFRPGNAVEDLTGA